MSRLSVKFRELFGKTITQTAEDLLRRYAGDSSDEIVGFAQQTVIAASDHKIDDGEKFKLASLAVKGFIAAAGVSIPGAIVDYFIHELVVRFQHHSGKLDVNTASTPPSSS